MQKIIIHISSIIVTIVALFLTQNKGIRENSLVGVSYLSNKLSSQVSENNEGVRRSDLPMIDYVPDESTAIRVAEAIWLPIYGKSIYTKRPFTARLENDSIWVVEGTLEEDHHGGVPYIEIQKSDCKILMVTHGK